MQTSGASLDTQSQSRPSLNSTQQSCLCGLKSASTHQLSVSAGIPSASSKPASKFSSLASLSESATDNSYLKESNAEESQRRESLSIVVETLASGPAPPALSVFQHEPQIKTSMIDTLIRLPVPHEADRSAEDNSYRAEFMPHPGQVRVQLNDAVLKSVTSSVRNVPSNGSGSQVQGIVSTVNLFHTARKKPPGAKYR